MQAFSSGVAFVQASYYLMVRAVSLLVSLMVTIVLLKKQKNSDVSLKSLRISRCLTACYATYFLIMTLCDILDIVRIVRFNLGFVASPILGGILFYYFNRELKKSQVVVSTMKSLILFLIGYGSYLLSQTILIFIGVYFVVGHSPIYFS